MHATMAKRVTRIRPWTKEEVRMLTTLAHEQTKTMVIAQKLKRTLGAMYRPALNLGVMLGEVGRRGCEGELVR
jgi:hypothetical protein